jgi:hypothetical protein
MSMSDNRQRKRMKPAGQARARARGRRPAAAQGPSAKPAGQRAGGLLRDLFPATMKHQWRRESTEEQQKNIESARRAYTSRGLVLYLGAGVSCSVGLPTWWEMIRSLTVTMMSERVAKARVSMDHDADDQLARDTLRIQQAVAAGAGADKSILMMARSIKDHFGERLPYQLSQALYAPLARSSEEWWNLVRSLKEGDELGSLAKFPSIPGSRLFEAIVQLARAQREVRGVQAIVNFNYDDLIEEWMREKGIRCDTILSGQQQGRDSSLPCYHVHGVLPFRKLPHMRRGNGVQMPPVVGNFVFSEDEYHTEYSDPYRWSNMTLINQLGRYSGLFIGLSLLDPNLRRVIDVTHRQYPDIKNYAILTRKPMAMLPQEADEPFLGELFEKVETESFKNIGVQVIWTDNYQEVPERILEICDIDRRNAAPIERRPPDRGRDA